MHGNVMFRGPRVKMGVYAGTPTQVVPHNTTGRADYFGPLVRVAGTCYVAVVLLVILRVVCAPVTLCHHTAEKAACSCSWSHAFACARPWRMRTAPPHAVEMPAPLCCHSRPCGDMPLAPGRSTARRATATPPRAAARCWCPVSLSLTSSASG